MAEQTMEDWAAQYGFVPARRAGGLVIFSGQIGMNAEGVVPADPEQQYHLVFAAIDAALEAEGLSKDKLVELLSFHANYPSHIDIFMRVKKEWLGDVLTCWTAIGCAALGTPETLVEIRVVAEAN